MSEIERTVTLRLDAALLARLEARVAAGEHPNLAALVSAALAEAEAADVVAQDVWTIELRRRVAAMAREDSVAPEDVIAALDREIEEEIAAEWRAS